ncbi:hypothetical protein ACQPZK_26400 [Micromonospora sp. CA-249363]|jgi:hypothetical protein|uniref:hypothetical protein n=1 Tax=Micromonospora sp. CA-249363 TaxID=3239963 RepID=UPI003D945508
MDGHGAWGRYGRSMAVAAGWYVTAIAAVAVGTTSVPSTPVGDDCAAWFSCLSPGESLAFVVLVWGAPVLVGLLFVTALVAALAARLVPSAVAAGTLSAVVALTLCGAVLAGLV